MGSATLFFESRLWPVLWAIFGALIGVLDGISIGNLVNYSWGPSFIMMTLFGALMGVMNWGDEMIDRAHLSMIIAVGAGAGIATAVISHAAVYSAAIALAFWSSAYLFAWVGKKPLETDELFLSSFFMLILGIMVGFVKLWGAWSLIGYIGIPAALYLYRKKW